METFLIREPAYNVRLTLTVNGLTVSTFHNQGVLNQIRSWVIEPARAYKMINEIKGILHAMEYLSNPEELEFMEEPSAAAVQVAKEILTSHTPDYKLMELVYSYEAIGEHS